MSARPCHLHFRHHKIGDCDLLLQNGRGTAEPRDHGTELAGSGNLGDLDVLDRRFRHAWVGRVGGILCQHQPAPLLDGNRPGRTVVERARQHDGDDPGAAGARGAAEQDVDCRTVAVLSRAAGGTQVIVDDDQVAIGWGEHDPARLQLLIRDGDVDRQRAGSLQDAWQCARPGSRNMQHHQDRRGQVWLEFSYELTQALNAAGRGTDHDNVATANYLRNASLYRVGCGAHAPSLPPTRSCVRADQAGDLLSKLDNLDFTPGMRLWTSSNLRRQRGRPVLGLVGNLG